MTNPFLDTLSARLETAKNESRCRTLVAHDPSMISFSSNDYLGLSKQEPSPLLNENALPSSRLVAGTSESHLHIESEFAKLFHTESALYFSSGFAANLSVLGSCLKDGDVVFSDALNHASLIDAMKLSKAKVVIYPHNDLLTLEQLLLKHRAQYNASMIVSETTFSMDGDSPDLYLMHDLAKQFDCGLYWDEAHTVGVRPFATIVPDAQLITLGKAIGFYGAVVLGKRAVIESIVNWGRSFVYTTAVPSRIMHEGLLRTQRALNAHEERQKLSANVQHMRSILNLGHAPNPSPIIPWIIGSDSQALAIATKFRSAGIHVTAIRPPTVPEGTARIRLSVSASHTHEALALFERVYKTIVL